MALRPEKGIGRERDVGTAFVAETWVHDARSNLVRDWPFIAGCIPSPSLRPDSATGE